MDTTKYKPGDYLQCGEGNEYTKVKLLQDDKVAVLMGLGCGQIISMKDWFILIGPNSASIENMNDVRASEPCPYIYDSLNDSGSCNNSCASEIDPYRNMHTSVKRKYSDDFSICSTNTPTSIRRSVSFVKEVPVIATMSATMPATMPSTTVVPKKWCSCLPRCCFVKGD